MLSIFQVTSSVCAPDLLMAGLAASENTRPVDEQDAALAVHVATVVKAELLSVPAAPAAAVHAAAFHETSPAVHVAAPVTGGVKEDAAARTERRNCFVADASTI